ncbi:MAG TPA: hypothetical protein VLL52_19090 [Anaerolineae bacterium]|nr:hypothetical protein [Anaerolineae bacterium]
MSTGKYTLPLIPFTPNQQKTINAYLGHGGVLDFALFNVAPHVVLTGYDLHQESAKQALWYIDDQLATYAKQSAQKSGTPIEYHYRLTFDYDQIYGRQLTLNQFLGSYFHHPTQALIIQNENNQYHPATNEQQQLPIPAKTEGYAYAFSHPPYPIRLKPATLNQYFHQINDILFGSLTTTLEIYEWAGPWSNYFEPGFEWWGAYLWTIYNPQRRQIATIAASATD